MEWLSQEANANRPFLLAFADDGVIWGKWEQGLNLAPSDFQGVATQLRGETLQQAFVFGENEEVRLFHDAAGQWAACKTTDVPDQDAFDEIHILWGDALIRAKDGFVHLRDLVQQGMDQILPLDLTQADLDKNEVPRLLVRHYIEYDKKTGEARVFLSRLVKLGKGPAAKEALQ